MLDDLRDGEGEYRWKNKDRYKGQWQSNMKHGEGTFYYKNGEIYIGQWYFHYSGLTTWSTEKAGTSTRRATSIMVHSPYLALIIRQLAEEQKGGLRGTEQSRRLTVRRLICEQPLAR